MLVFVPGNLPRGLHMSYSYLISFHLWSGPGDELDGGTATDGAPSLSPRRDLRRTSASWLTNSSPSATGSSSPSRTTARSSAPGPRRQPAQLPTDHAPDDSHNIPREEELGARRASAFRVVPLLPVVGPMYAIRDSEHGSLAEYS